MLLCAHLSHVYGHSGLCALSLLLTKCLHAVQTNWYAVVASAEFMLHDVQNEAFAEQLRERRRLLLERDTDVNFFLVSEPAWLDEQFPDKAKQLRRPCVALVAPDQQWIT